MSFTSTPAAAERVEAAFREAGLDGLLHVLDIDSGAEIGLRGDTVCASASTGKLPILVALMRAVAGGELTLEEQIEVPAQDRTDGTTGLSTMVYPARLALGDIARLMMAVSDNHATDLVLQRVPPGKVTAAMRELGLTVTAVEMTIKEFFAGHESEVDDEVRALGTWAEAAAWRTTPAEMCRLLRAVWRDEAAPAELCEQMRRILRSCLTTNGLDCELPLRVQATSGRKTGTLMVVEGDGSDAKGLVMRHEIGVVEFPDGHRYAVAAFTRWEGSGVKMHDMAAAQALGTAVRVAIDQLRQGLPGKGLADR